MGSQPRFCSLLRGRTVGVRTIEGRNHRGSSYCGLRPLGARNYQKSSLRGSSHWKSSHCGSGPSELKPSGASHHRCDVNKRQGCFGGRKNNRLIGKKPPNLVGTEEKNHGRKVLIVVQSSRINLSSGPVVRGVITLYSQSTSWPVVRRITPFAIHIAVSST